MATTPTELRAIAQSAPMLSADEEAELLRRVAESDDSRAMSRLVESHLRLVLSAARKFHRAGLSMDDLIAEGMLGLVEAARRFDPAKGARFATYAAWWVRALVRRFALANRRVVGAPSTRGGRRAMSRLRDAERKLTSELGTEPTRKQLADHLELPIEEVASAQSALSGRDVRLDGVDGTTIELPSDWQSPEEVAARRELAREVRRSVSRGLEVLDAREREIIQRRLLADDAETLCMLGTRLGISRERVRQIEALAKRKMREQMLELSA